MDDGILYTSTSSTTDLTKPTAATSFVNGTVTSSSVGFSWTNGADAATGIQNTIILRTTNTAAAAPVLNDQGVYSTAGGASGPNTVATNWTVISTSVAAAATTFTDSTVAANTSYKYAVVHRDLAYNYSVALMSGTITTPPAISTFTSTQPGDWNTGATWVGGAIPTLGSNVVIDHAVTLAAPPTNVPNNVTVNLGASLATGANFSYSGATTINGTFQINSGGFTTGSTFTYGAGATLIFSTGSNYGVNNDSYWPTSNGPTNVTVSGSGGITMNVARTVPGVFLISFGVSGANNLTLNGTCQINGGGFFNSSSPNYGIASTLLYNTAYSVGNEWTTTGVGTIGTSRPVGAGQPANVTIQAGNLTMDNNPRYLPGNFTITGGGITLAGGGDLTLGGNWSRAAGTSFNHNNIGVWFTGAFGTQTISAVGGETFGYLLINKAAGSVQLLETVTMTGNGGDVLQLLGGTLDLNGRSLTLQNSGGNIRVGNGVRNIVSATSADVFIQGDKTVTNAGGGSLVVGDNIFLVLTAGLNCGSGLVTVGGGTSGSLLLNAGGYLATQPRYGAGSTLIYNTGGTYGRASEWLASAGPAGTPGYPHHVRLTNNTTLDYPNGFGGALAMGGSLEVEAGSSLYMDFGGTPVGSLTVAGNVTLGGNLSLGSTVGGDLNLGGHWTRTAGVFTPNNRSVNFNGASSQTISGAANTVFAYLGINNAAGVVVSQTVGVTNQLNLTNGIVNTTAGQFTIHATAVNAITGGSATAYINGPLRRTLPIGLSLGSDYAFPIGKGGVYAPYDLVSPTTTGGSPAIVSVEVFSANSGGTGSLTLNTNRYWETTVPTNFSSLIGTSIRLTDPGIGTANVVATSNALSGTYNSIGGSVAGNSITSNPVTAANYLPYVVMAAATPLITVTPNSLSGFNYIVGTGPSAAQSFDLSGAFLTPASGNLTVDGSINYEVSTDNVNFFSSGLTVPYTGGTLATTPIYVRLKAGLPPGFYNPPPTTVLVTGGGAGGKVVNCFGQVNQPLITTVGTLTPFATEIGTPSAPQSFSASGSNLLADIVVATPAGYEVSLASGGPYTSTVNLAPTANTVPSTPVFVRLTGAGPAGTYNGNVTLNSTSAIQKTVAATGTVREATPTVAASAATVAGTGTATAIVNWTRGDGGSVLVVMRAGGAVDANPVNGTTYTGSATFGSGDQIGTGNYVIYNGPGSSTVVSGLTAATTYHVAIYEFNGAAALSSYRTVDPARASGTTLTNAPATPTFASVTATTFTVNWAAVTGAASYRLDLATDNAFTSFVSGYQDFAVATNSQAVSGLAPNTPYFARVRAINAGGQASDSSATGTATTAQLPAPVAVAATAITSTTATANWNAVTGATDYRYDVYRKQLTTTTDLFFSEYVEGTSNNKYVEIYNGTGSAVNLADYRLRFYANGNATPSQDVVLSGTLPSGATVVLRNSAATIYGGATVVNAAVIFNGNDALALFKISTASNVDIFGRIGENPVGGAWTATGLSTVDRTLRRKTSVTGGVTVNPASGFPTLATEWDSFVEDTISGLGSHVIPPTLVYDHTDLSSAGALFANLTGLTPGTTYFYVARATSTNSTSPNSNEISFTTATPTLALTGTPLSFATTYGAASASQSFNVSGSNLVADATVNAPIGYEVSTDDLSFGATATYTPSGGSVTGSVYVRIAALTAPSVALGTSLTLTSASAVTQSLTLSGTVGKATPTIAVTGATSFIYSGSPQGPAGTNVTGVSGGLAPSGTITFSYVGVSPTTYGPSATAPTNAGSYEATASIATDANYTAASSTAFAFVIDKATPTVTLQVLNSPVIYNGALNAPLVGYASGPSTPGTIANILVGGAAGQQNVGIYAVTANFVPTDSANYHTLVGLPAGNFEIVKATPILSVTNSPQTYNGSPKSANVTGNVPGVASNVLLDGLPTQTNAGTYAVTADFAPTDSVNYHSLSGASAGNFVINKAVQFGSFRPLPIKRTGDAPFVVSAISVDSLGNPTGLTFSFLSSNPGVATVAGDTVTIVGPGTTIITASQPGDGNYHAATFSGTGFGPDQDLVVVPAADVLLAWEFNGLTSSGPSPFGSAVTATNLSASSLVRGAGLADAANPSILNGWGGVGFSPTSAADSIANDKFVTFTVQASSGYAVSLQKIEPYMVKRFTGGAPINGRWQYSLDGTNFTDLTADLFWGGSNGTGLRQAEIDLSGIGALQNVPSTTTVTFRVVNWGGSGGNWALQDFPAASGLDLVVTGSVASSAPPTLVLTGPPAPFSTTFGTASTAQSFPVSGSNLTANATVTAPTGYEVSTDGTAYGATAVYTPTSGSFSGSVFVRLAANSRPSVPLGFLLEVTSAGASPQGLFLSGGVNKKGLNIAVTGSNSFTFNGTQQGPSGYNVTGAVPGFPPMGAVMFSYVSAGGPPFGPNPFRPTLAGPYNASVTIADDGDYLFAGSPPFGFIIDKATPTLVITGSTTYTYNASAQGPTTYQVTGVPGFPPMGSVMLSYQGSGFGPSPFPPFNAGAYMASGQLASDTNYHSAVAPPFFFSIAQRDLTITADSGQFKNKGAAEPPLTYTANGLQGSDFIIGSLQRAPGEAAGVYAISQGSLNPSPNYNLTGFTGANFAIAGPLGAADSASKPTDSTAIKIPIATLLGNDQRVTPAGTFVSSNLSLTAVAPGVGNGVTIGGAFVFFSPNPSVSSESFTYTLTDTSNGTTDTVTVTVTTAGPDNTPFTLNVVNVGLAAYDSGEDETSKVIDFIAVPGQNIIIEYALTMSGPWIQATDNAGIPTGSMGSFFLTLTAPGDQTGPWNNAMFFRGRRP